jgi:phosphatidate cytidylyltransferase
MAFAWGKSFGRHKLIGVSPSKTWEGFLGAAFSMLPQAYFMSMYMMAGNQREFWGCGSYKYEWAPFPRNECELHEVFHHEEVALPAWVQTITGVQYINSMPVVQWSMIFGVFSALCGPFAGFVASGYKRAYGLKDFGTLFPGHGGITDRYDCQIYNVLFVALILRSFILY